jgi:histo-blood group ABO system transferase
MFCLASSLNAVKIGLLVMATGKYIQFVEPLLKSADEHFCTDHDVTYFVFTDQEIDFFDKVQRSIVRIEQKRLGWPYDTLMRIPIYLKHKEAYIDCDYLFALDADMLFVDAVGSEILGELVATQHPGFVGQRGTYETRKISTACVACSEGEQYFAGGFNGGSRDTCLHMYETIAKNIEIDLNKNFIALWHDESHINRYFIDHKPAVILDPSYCYPGCRKIPYEPKLMALDKNHKEMRSK